MKSITLTLHFLSALSLFQPQNLHVSHIISCTTTTNTHAPFTTPLYNGRIFFRRRSKQLQSLSQQKSALPIAGLPVNCCGPTPSPNGPLGSLATLSAFNSHKVKRSFFGNRNKLTITKL